MREVLGGGSGGRYYADGEDTIHVVPDSRNLPIEFTEAPVPVRRRAARPGRGLRRGRAVTAAASGTRSTSGCSRTPTSCRSRTARSSPCWGVRGGRAGRPFQVVIDPGGPHEREVDALADAEPVRAGEVIRIRTTGGGGWGDPLEREPDAVVRDVVWRKVSPASALRRLRRGADRLPRRRHPRVRRRGDLRATGRAGRTRGEEAFFDRGPGFLRLSGTRVADVDWV